MNMTAATNAAVIPAVAAVRLSFRADLFTSLGNMDRDFCWFCLLHVSGGARVAQHV
jgi:hypothetical protein